MKILNSKWLEKIFFITCGLLLVWLTLGFIFVGGYVFLLFLEEYGI